MKISKKTYSDYFEEILSGKKKFDLRLNELNIKEGDVLELIEIDEKTKKPTGRKLEKKIQYVLKTKNLDWWSEEEVKKRGYIVMGF